MRITQDIQAALFLFLGLRVTKAWLSDRQPQRAHLATATMLFGLNSLQSSIVQTIYDSTKGEIPPRVLSILSLVLIFSSMYAFLLFLSDFIHFPRWASVLSVIATVANVVLGVIERPDLRIAGTPPRLEKISGIENPFPYIVYLQYVLVYLAIVFGVLWVSFLIYALRVRALARFRMLSISGGFALLFIAVALIPRLFFGKPPSGTITLVTNVIRYLALASAPLLLMGFAPPRWISRRFAGEQSTAEST